MTEQLVTILQMPGFKKSYKKLHHKHRACVDKAIQAIINEPKIGTAKKGDLADVFVYKFKIGPQEMLLAYEWNPALRILLALGVHENFYRDLKR